MPIQDSYISRVRALIDEDVRVTAALMYGSFARGDGDKWSDIEFFVFLPASVLVELDREAWCRQIAPIRHSLVNEFGTFVVIFDTFIRGEFHFVPDEEISAISDWVFEKLEPERMVLKDSRGDLRRALQDAAGTPLWESDSDARREQSERLLNWLLLAANVYERGEYARALDAISYAHRFLLRSARIRNRTCTGVGSEKMDHWLNPMRGLESRAGQEVLGRYAHCTSTTKTESLRSALEECWQWGLELATGGAMEPVWRDAIAHHQIAHHPSVAGEDVETGLEASSRSTFRRSQQVGALARRIASKLGEVDGVVAVVLGGSRASGLSTEDSDLDLGIYYESERQPSIAALERVATALQGGRACKIAAPGEWGRWMNGGGWLDVEGTRVDWIFRDLDRVRDVFSECISGAVTSDSCLGYPHGFHSHYYLSEVYFCEPLIDRDGRIEALSASLTPFPPRLRQALIEKFLYEAGFTLDGGERSARRGDVFHAVSCVLRAAAALIQVTFALNERFSMSEKRSLDALEGLPIQPSNFGRRLEALLTSPAAGPPALQKTYGEMRALLNEVRALAPKLSYAWPS